MWLSPWPGINLKRSASQSPEQLKAREASKYPRVVPFSVWIYLAATATGTIIQTAGCRRHKES